MDMYKAGDSLDICEMKAYLFSRYPSGIMNGTLINDMPYSRVFAIYNRLVNTSKVIKGQISLFD